jgi:hypothetical protein
MKVTRRALFTLPVAIAAAPAPAALEKIGQFAVRPKQWSALVIDCLHDAPILIEGLPGREAMRVEGSGVRTLYQFPFFADRPFRVTIRATTGVVELHQAYFRWLAGGS